MRALAPAPTAPPARRRRAAPLRCSATPPSTKVSVTKRLQYGQALRVVGDCPSLGSWKPEQAPALCWSEGDVWVGEVAAPVGTKYKLVVVSPGGGCAWEEGSDREWEGQGECALAFGQPAAGSRAPPPAAPPAAPPQEQLAPPPAAAGGVELATSAEGRWQGASVKLMRSNEHTGQRRGGWQLDGLQGAARAVVEGDTRAGSWLGKLEVVAELVGRDKSQARGGSCAPKSALLTDALFPAFHQELDPLACSAIYLQWVSTGLLPCVEAGGHQRPSRNAVVARSVFVNLERALGASMYGSPGVDEQPRLAARRLLPWLPSFAGAFTQAVPLTRIRDIAHRNDIPSDLKQEIKHTLQNKLHRNAGPEDLVATEAVLARVLAAPQNTYPQSFLDEFVLFHSELKEFFNASSTMDRLASIAPGFDEPAAAALRRLRASKEALDAATPQALQAWAAAHAQDAPGAAAARERELALETLHAATELRACCVAALASGLRNDASDDAIASRQAWRAAEQSLEQYAFVLASRCTGALEREGGAGALAPEKGPSAPWGPALTAALLSVRHLGLSGFRPAECAAVESGLAAARDAPGLPGGRDAAARLRVRAACQRARRLAEAHADALAAVFAPRAPLLAQGLGLTGDVGAAAGAQFAEAEIRASTAFALSNALEPLLRASAAGGAPGECVVGGCATGVLQAAPRFTPGSVRERPEGTVLLLSAADGDEELGGCGVTGVLLTQQLPHLSHLAVRARAEKRVLATCDVGEAPQAAALALLGQRVVLTASPEGGVTLRAATSADGGPSSATHPPPAKQAALAPPPRAGPVALIPLEAATAATCGAKAAICGELARVAAAATVQFSAPPGAVLPFGAMEAALEAAGSRGRYDALLATLASAADPAAVAAACADVRALLAALRPPEALLAALQAALPPGGCCVRSSANVEDLAGMPAAGLYESVTGVSTSDAAALGAAIGAVWASLHSPRAVSARRAAGVPPTAACMAVLVQAMVPAELCFVLHTCAPGTAPGTDVLAEVAAGLGETLASAQPGSAWRLIASPAPGTSGGPWKVHTAAFANLATALRPPAAAGGAVTTTVVDYGRQALSGYDPAPREALGGRLAEVGRALEAALGGVPQDVEGCLVGDALFVVQSRPQPLE